MTEVIVLTNISDYDLLTCTVYGIFLSLEACNKFLLEVQRPSKWGTNYEFKIHHVTIGSDIFEILKD